VPALLELDAFESDPVVGIRVSDDAAERGDARAFVIFLRLHRHAELVAAPAGGDVFRHGAAIAAAVDVAEHEVERWALCTVGTNEVGVRAPDAALQMAPVRDAGDLRVVPENRKQVAHHVRLTSV